MTINAHRKGPGIVSIYSELFVSYASGTFVINFHRVIRTEHVMIATNTMNAQSSSNDVILPIVLDQRGSKLEFRHKT